MNKNWHIHLLKIGNFNLRIDPMRKNKAIGVLLSEESFGKGWRFEGLSLYFYSFVLRIGIYKRGWKK